jgi:ketosteroid isomerase-like protein
MKNLIIIFVMFIYALPFNSRAQTKAEGAATAQASEQEIIKKLEREWYEAIKARDRAAIDRLLSVNFISQGRTKDVINKEKAIVNLAGEGGGENWSVKPKDIRVNVYSEDAAIASGRITIKSSVEGAGKGVRYNYTHMYVKRDGVWMIASENLDALDQPE